MLINGIEFFEDAQEPRSPEQQYANDGGRVTRTLQRRDPSGVTERDRWEAARALIGYPQLVRVIGGGGSVLYIARSLPDAYVSPRELTPDANDYLRASAILRTAPDGAVQGVDINDAPIYPCVRYTVQYNTLPYFVRPDDDMIAASGPMMGYPDEGLAVERSWWQYSRYVSRTPRAQGQVYTLPQGFAKRIDTKQPVKQGLPLRVTEGIFRYTWHQVPVQILPERLISQTLNKVNDAPFDGKEIGTLMLEDAEWTNFRTSLGLFLADVTYTMRWKPNYDPVSQLQLGWNSFLMFDKITGQFRFVQVSSDGNFPLTDPGLSNNALYPYAKFADLFRPDQS